MKKSIKYAGIAAATLLAVAPVAAPVVSSTTTVKAAGNADQSDVNKATTNFKDQFGDRDNTDLETAGKITLNSNLPLGENAATDLASFITNTGNLIKTPIDTTTDAGKADLKALTDQGAKAYVEVVAGGVTYDGSVGKDVNELTKALSLDSNLPATVNVYLKSNTLAGSEVTTFSKLTSFSINKSDEDELTSVNAKFTTPLNVALNSKTLATQLVNGANVSIEDQNGDSLATKNIQLSNRYYYNYSQAMDNAKSGANIGNVEANKSTDVIKDGEFKKAGTYYQVVKYLAQPSSALQSMIDDYQTDPTGYTVYVNGKKASAGYDFVMGTSKNSTSDATSYKTISFVRAINVSNNESQWTTEDITGQVETKSDTAYYTLKNDEGNTISNRALAKNTAWLTDQKRTDQNGNVQYRVATGEWINADDVTYSENGSNNNGSTEGALTDLQSVSGVVNLDTPGYVYFLYNKDGVQLTNRALTGGTSWRTDTVAKNANGDTMYRVATNEWLQAKTGLNYVAD